jgi:hypothetical protein
MAAYLIVEVGPVRDEAAYAAYRSQVPASVARRAVVICLGRTVEALEGDWSPERVVVVRLNPGPQPGDAGVARVRRAQGAPAGVRRLAHGGGEPPDGGAQTSVAALPEITVERAPHSRWVATDWSTVPSAASGDHMLVAEYRRCWREAVIALRAAAAAPASARSTTGSDLRGLQAPSRPE